jgi:rubrerythrin
MKHWTNDDISWEKFNPSKVDPELLKVVKASALVEKNGYEYARYLQDVFADDQGIVDAAEIWAAEEVQHGDALGKWAEMADPSFDFQSAFEDFKSTILLPEDASNSIRGSRTGEFIARCVVECGTSSLYAAMAAAAEEPVLKEIAQKIAGDELRHYKLFYSYAKRYQKQENLSRWKRFKIAFGRAAETDDDELAYAYYAANHRADGPYNRDTYSRLYVARAYDLYRYRNIERAAAMAFKSIGLKPYGLMCRTFARVSFGFMKWRVRRFRRWEQKHGIQVLAPNSPTAV